MFIFFWVLGYCPGTDGLGGRDEGEMERKKREIMKIEVKRVQREGFDFWTITDGFGMFLALDDREMKSLGKQMKKAGF